MDDAIKAYCADQAEALTAGNVYCDVVLSAAEAVALRQLVKALRAGGQHRELDRVFTDIEDVIERAGEPETPWS